MEKTIWTKYFARKFCTQRFEVVLSVFQSDFYRREFGVHLDHVLITPDKGNHAIYYLEEEWKNFSQNVYVKACRDLETFQRYRGMIREAQKRYVNVARDITRQDLSALTDAQLLQKYQLFADTHQDFFNVAIWIPFITEPFVSTDAEKILLALLQQRGMMDRYNEYFEVVFSPDEKNAITREYLDFLQLALDVRDGEPHARWYLANHLKKYAWVPCYDIYDTPWDEKYFQNRLRELRMSSAAIEQEMTDIQKRFEERPRKFQELLAALRPDESEEAILRMAHEMAFIKDERDDYRRQGSFLIQPLFHEIGRRAGLSLREVTHLLRRETEQFLEERTVPDLGDVRARVNGYVLLKKGESPTEVYSGVRAQQVLQQELGNREDAVKQLVAGLVGSKGVVTGVVQRVITKHDLRHVVDGAIMVTVTTHPDFVPAMRKCRAIVTDEGGITSHAAIVSREMGIPCIVGTRQATEVFIDGDEVVVDAVKGVVTKIHH